MPESEVFDCCKCEGGRDEALSGTTRCIGGLGEYPFIYYEHEILGMRQRALVGDSESCVLGLALWMSREDESAIINAKIGL